MRTFGKILGILFLSASPAFANPGPSDDQTLKWLRDFEKIYRSAKTWPELLRKLPNVQAGDRIPLSKLLEKEPLPPLSASGFSLRSGKTEVTVLSLKNRDFKVNGKYLQLTANAKLSDTVRKVFEASKNPSALSPLWHLLGGPAAFAQKDRRLYSLQEELLTDPTRVSDQGWGFLALAIPGVGPALAGGLAADYLMTKGEAWVSPSCDQQMKELAELMRQEKVGLADIDCGEDYRGLDRSVSFWLPSPNGQPVKREFELDYRQGTLIETKDEDEEEEPASRRARNTRQAKKPDTTLYLFNRAALREVRTLQEQDGRLRRVDYKPGSPEFERYQREMEPMRKVLYYIGNNRTCDKCDTEIKEKLTSKRPPDYVAERPRPAPGSGTRGRR